jgi:hypothetical protein
MSILYTAAGRELNRQSSYVLENIVVKESVYGYEIISLYVKFLVQSYR